MLEQDSATVTAITIEMQPEPEPQPVLGQETDSKMPHSQPDVMS